jgi:acyl-CoA reductase-like NAD-dependent aldehyde dehydrogenase
VALANDSAYGLSATLWTQNLTKAHSLAARLKVGAVAINGWSPLDARLPWGAARTAAWVATCRGLRSMATSRRRSSPS